MNTVTAAEQWAVYFRYVTDRSKRTKINEVIANEEGIAMASEVLITISKDDAERARLRSEWKYEMDFQSKMVEAKREGWKAGQKAGQKAGRKEGEKEGRKKVALNLKNLGISVEQIVQVTGLSIEDIAKL
jgi:predicted transposase/invertase (TIGR01784 family)